MFSERYIQPENKTDEKKEQKKGLFSFLGKKKQKKEKSKNELKENKAKKPKQENKPKAPKKKRSTTFYGLVFFSVFISIIMGLKAWKAYKIESQKTITKEDQQNFAKEFRKQEPVKKAEVVKTKPKQENGTINDKRIISSYLMSQGVSILFENDGTKIVISGIPYKIGEKFYKDFFVSRIDTEGEGGDIDNAKIVFTIMKNDTPMKKLSVRFGDTYKIDYFYESIEVMPIDNPAMKTGMIFIGDKIKKDFYFTDFKDENESAIFTFELLGKKYIKTIPLDDLN